MMRQLVGVGVELARSSACGPRTITAAASGVRCGLRGEQLGQRSRARSAARCRSTARRMVSRSAGSRQIAGCRSARSASAMRRQQPQKSLLMAGEIGRGVQRRIGVEVDPQRTAVRAVVDRDRQILDRPERKIVRGRAVAGEAEAVVERHDVDAQPEQRPALDARRRRRGASRRADSAGAADACAHPPRRLVDDLGHRHAGMQRKPQRQHVGGHAGDAPRRLARAPPPAAR